MSSAATTERYSGTAIALHWLLALALLGSFIVGVYMSDLPVSPQRLKLYNWHKWAGICILALSALRLLWRLTHRPPADVAMPEWQRRSAHAVHILLYLLFFAVPLAGWAYSSAAGFPVVVFGVLPLPDFVAPSKELAEAIKPLHKILAFTMAALFAAPACAQQLVPAGSEIAFTSKQMGVPVDGRFRKFDAKVAFDPKKPEAANIAFSVDLASVSLGVAETEAEIAKPDWFDTKKFPQAQFQSSGVKATGGGKYEVTGRLTIKGTAQNLVVPVTLTQSGGNTTAAGSFVLKRLAFRIGDGDWKDTSMVADDVQVRFKLALTGVGAL